MAEGLSSALAVYSLGGSSLSSQRLGKTTAFKYQDERRNAEMTEEGSDIC